MNGNGGRFGDADSGWGGPGQPAGVAGGAPDWAALAAANERETRRKRVLRLGVGVVSGLVLAGVVGVAVTVTGTDDSNPSAQPSVQAQLPEQAQPSAQPSVQPTAAAAGGDLQLGGSARVGAVDGHSGPALTLDGHSDGFGEAASTSIDTSASFTVSAVVRNDASMDPKAAVSQGADAFFSFYLGREDSSSATRNRWVFKIQSAAEAGKAVMALSSGPAALGRWTTLTGVYDARAKTISLYVDGALAQTTPAPAVLPSTEPLEIGRARYRSHWVDFWKGSIADVQVWDRALAPAAVARLAGTGSADVPPRAGWFRP